MPSAAERADAAQRIVELKQRYVSTVDAKEWAALAECLTEDFKFDGQFTVRGAQAFADSVSADLASAVNNARAWRAGHPRRVA